MPLEIIREDIRRVKVDAIVNPTDENYSGSGGTDYKVHKAAGERLDEEVSRLPKLNVGDARITSSFSMDNTFYIIHTRGPIYIDGKHNEDKLLRRCYENCLRIVKEKKLQSVALPLISTGTFGFPLKEAMKIASNVITDFIFDNDIYVYLLVYNRQAFDISKKFHQDIKDYLKDNGVDEEDYYDEKEYIGYRRSRRNIKDNNPVVYNPIDDNFMDDYENTESFNECLKRFIYEKNLAESDVYKGANLSKQAFNKIYNEGSIPKKNNVLALAVGMKLNVFELEELINKAGYHFGIERTDYIVRYYIEHNIYSYRKINEMLASEGLSQLGSQYRD